MKTRFRNLPIGRKLTLITTLVGGLALLLACLGFMAYDLITYRATLARELAIQARIIGANSSAALLFGDEDTAESNLAALAAEPRIMTAYLYDLSNHPVARYHRPDVGDAPAPPVPDRELHRFNPGDIECFQPILLNGHAVGTIYLRSDLNVLYARLRNYLGIAALVFLASILAAMLLSLWLQRFITGPVDRLLHTIRLVARQKDYGLRAVREGDDELGRLADGFNAMLAEIQHRDARLSDHRDRLEAEVADRTADLQQANAALTRARDRAEAASRLKTALLTNMSHEIRTPIAGILGVAAILRDDLPAEQTELIDLIERSGRRLLDTLTAMLDLARLDAGDLTLKPTLLDLRERIDECVAPFREAARRKGLAFLLDVPTAPLPVMADPYGLETILHHLLDNAVKFTAKGTVRVALAPQGSDVVLRICDTGTGIPPDFLPHLYEPFKQASMGMARSHEGNGLGLAVTRRMVELMQGTVAVESTPGTGTCVTVTLPRHARPVTGPRQGFGASSPAAS